LKTTIKQGNKDSRREECRGGNRVKGGLNGRERGPIESLFQRGIFRHGHEKSRGEKEWCI